ncbi:MAG TPA: Uma2 family endonuclease [Solirubrobacteraceae bacterium]|nr:Uma2 family endonuclease [Solirubrobacteraceae bacterium]
MAAAPATTLPLHRLDVETYNRIVASGALESQHVELLDGTIVDMSPQSPAHATVVEVLTRHFAAATERLRVQLPLEVSGDSEPEPDLALVREPAQAGHHPRSAVLVIEVAVSSQPIDRNVKARLYAHAGIPTYWLIDVPARAVEIRTKPGEQGYESVKTYKLGETAPCPLDGVPDLDIAALLANVAD